MLRVSGVTALVVTLTGTMAADLQQVASSDPPALAFEAASVKRAPADAGALDQLPADISSSGNRWSARNATISMLLMTLDNLSMEQIVGGPSWLHTERFDIIATAGEAGPDAHLTQMARQLLVDRFRLRTHIEQRPFNAYALVLARPDGRLGPGLRPNAPCTARAEARARGVPPPPVTPGPPPQCGRASMRTVEGVRQLRMTGQPIANLLTLTGARAALGGLVVDRTGLTGTFDIDIDYVPLSVLTTSGDTAQLGSSVVAAVEGQLGLTFERRREMMDVLVIDNLEMPEAD